MRDPNEKHFWLFIDILRATQQDELHRQLKASAEQCGLIYTGKNYYIRQAIIHLVLSLWLSPNGLSPCTFVSTPNTFNLFFVEGRDDPSSGILLAYDLINLHVSRINHNIITI